MPGRAEGFVELSVGSKPREVDSYEAAAAIIYDSVVVVVLVVAVVVAVVCGVGVVLLSGWARSLFLFPPPPCRCIW